jgi:hypothetical protein
VRDWASAAWPALEVGIVSEVVGRCGACACGGALGLHTGEPACSAAMAAAPLGFVGRFFAVPLAAMAAGVLATLHKPAACEHKPCVHGWFQRENLAWT